MIKDISAKGNLRDSTHLRLLETAMQYLNIIYFLIISYWGFRLLKTPAGIVRGTLDKDQEWRYTGPELFWCLTFSTGLLAFSANVGLDLMAIRLGVLELFCLIGLSMVKENPIINLPMKIYFIYIGWLIIGCFYGPSIGYGLRVILKYSYPLLLCLFASSAVREGEVFLKSSMLARMVALVTVVFSFIPYIERAIPGVIWFVTARSINYISIMIFSLGLFYFSPEKKKNLIYVCISPAMFYMGFQNFDNGISCCYYGLLFYKIQG